MKINTFNGGLNLRHDSSLLQPNEGQVVSNVDLSSGGLVPVKDKTLVTGQPVTPYLKYFEAINTWQSSDIEASFVEYRNKLYIAKYDEVTPTSIIVNDGTGEAGVGLVAPDLVEVDSTTQEPIELVKNGDFSTYAISGSVYNPDYWTNVLSSGTTLFNSIWNGLLTMRATGGVAAGPDFNCAQHWLSDSMSFVPGLAYEFKVSAAKSEPWSTGSYDIFLSQDTSALWHVVTDIVPDSPHDGKAPIRTVTFTPTSSTNALDVRRYHTQSTSDFGVEGRLDDVSIKLKYIPEIAFTYYNSLTGVESIPTFDASVYNQTTNTISWSFIASAPAEATELRIYHRGYATGTFSLIASVATTATSYIMPLTADIPVDGKVLDSYSNTVSPTNLRYLAVAYARLFAAKDTKLYFSEIADFGYWPANNFLEMDDTITGIAAVYSGLIVMTQFRIYIVTGTTEANFAITQISGTIGCVSHYSIAYLDGSAIWLSNEGLMISNGGRIENFSYSKLGDMQEFRVGDTFQPSFGLTYRNKYYLAFANTDGYGANAILVVDKTEGISFSVLTSYGESLALAEGGLYSVLGTELFKAFNGTAKALEYKSGALVDGSITIVKLYNSVYVSYSGDITIEFFIDQVSVLSHNLSSVNRTTAEINLPAGKQRGYEISYKVTGTGSVYELEYKIKGRDNGK